MKTKFILIPKNEGHELYCRVKINCSKKQAMNVARKMAVSIDAALLAQCDITVSIQTVSEELRGADGIIARWDGKFVDGATGEFIKN